MICSCGGWRFYTVAKGKLAVKCIACGEIGEPPKVELPRVAMGRIWQ